MHCRPFSLRSVGAGKPLKFFEEFQHLAELAGESPCGETVSFRNPVCGDVVEARVELEGEVLKTFQYKAKGCWPVHSCLAWLAGRFEGQKVTAATTFTIDAFLKEVDGVPVSKRHAFAVSLRALQGAVSKAWIERAGNEYKVGPAV